jgi:DNA-binding transcriptional MerR regulator
MKAHFNTVKQVRRMGAFGFKAHAIARDTGLPIADIRLILKVERPHQAWKRKRERAAAWKLLKEGVPINVLEKSFRLTTLQRIAMVRYLEKRASTLPAANPSPTVST